MTHDHPAHLAHHFDTSPQQFEAAKLGMWLFLATEVLLFGGLFCLYAVYRHNHPEIFHYGSRFLNTTWGAINTVVLIVSSATMAMAVWCAQCGDRRRLKLFLGITLFLAGDFLAIKYIEYSEKFRENLVWGPGFYQEPAGAEPGAALEASAAEPFDADPEQGQKIWQATCRSCHGPNGGGMPGLGKNLRKSAFVQGKTDEELLAFVKEGRPPSDPLNTTGVYMPPRGGNPLLDDHDLLNVIALVRTFQVEGASEPDVEVTAAAQEFFIPKSSIPLAGVGPPGLAAAFLDGGLGLISSPGPAAEGASETGTAPVDRAHDPTRPANAHLFFGLYFLMTGLHGMHVLAGMGLILWLLLRSARGEFDGRYFTPVDLGGLYWHVVDMIWIFLFPLLYLIR